MTIRHCTLVPGWTLEPDCEPGEPEEASLEVALKRGKVTIEHSILGSIQVTHNEVKEDPLAIEISDSILDATRPTAMASSAAAGLRGAGRSGTAASPTRS